MEDSIDTGHLSNNSPDDKLLNGASFIAIVILGVLENIFEICPFKRTNLNNVGLGGLLLRSRNVSYSQIFSFTLIHSQGIQ